jgi:hypothetical protein
LHRPAHVRTQARKVALTHKPTSPHVMLRAELRVENALHVPFHRAVYNIPCAPTLATRIPCLGASFHLASLLRSRSVLRTEFEALARVHASFERRLPVDRCTPASQRRRHILPQSLLGWNSVLLDLGLVCVSLEAWHQSFINIQNVPKTNRPPTCASRCFSSRSLVPVILAPT